MTPTPKTLALLAGTLAGTLGGAAQAEFLKDSKATLNLRNFYINNDVRNQASPSIREWGQAFMLDYKSGLTEGPVGVGLDVLGLWGVRLDSGGNATKKGRSRTPGSVFPLSGGEAEDQFGSLGLTGKVKISKTEARLGTLQPRLPVVLPNDGRLLPQTYEGGQITSNEIDNLTLIGGQLEHTKLRASSDRESLSAAGPNKPDTNKFYYGGADYRIGKNLLLQYYYGNLEDYYQQHFLGLTHNWAIGPGALKSDLRYFHSSSDGKNKTASGRAAGYVSNGYYGNGVTRGKVDNNAWSGLFTYSLKGHEISAGYQQLTGSSDFPFINTGDGSTSYLITNMQIGKFQHAGERSWLAKYGYDFANVGVPGLKASIAYVYGDNVDTRFGDQTQHETNVRLDYVIQSGPLKNLGFTWQGAQLRSDSGIKGVGRTGAGAIERNQDENRLIVNYSIPLM